MNRRAYRLPFLPRPKQRRLTWPGILDALCWVIVIISGCAAAAWLLSATVNGLARSWL